MLIEGGISYDQRPNANVLGRLVKDKMNTNTRLILRGLNPFDRTPSMMSEKDFSEDVVNALRQAIVNREHELSQGSGDSTKREISYGDYGPSTLTGKKIFAPAISSTDDIIRFQNVKDPVYNAQTAIGSAQYTVDPAGYVTLQDTWDINKGTGLENPWLNGIHSLARLVGNPYQIRMGLGNINKWGMTPSYR